MLIKKDGYATQGIKIKIKRQKARGQKSLGGRNRLTDAEIDKLQRYYGLITKLKVLDLLNIQPGFYTCRALQEADHARIRKAEKAISRRTKEARIKNRQLKCRQEDDLADDPSNPVMVLIGTDHAHIRKAENAISQRTKQARIKNRLLKCRQEDDLADDPSNPSYGSGMY
ncbi:hypothetical protein TNCV_983021 [Trichonephila clavipes]|nr:hypothetical protein TNCV_983021 [Trichonephila clavipes]